jgi:hypothetical protein
VRTPVIAVLGAVVAATLGACTHGAPATTTPANFGPGGGAAGDDDLALIPAQAAFVLHVDAGALRASPIFTKWLAPQLAASHALTRIASVCGFDPVAQLTSLTFAATGGMADDGAAELILHGLPRDRMTACLPKLATATTAIRQDGGTWLVAGSPGQRAMAIRFPGDRVALIALGPTSPADVDALLGHATLATSAAFARTHAQLRAAPVWFVTTPPAILDLIPMMGIRAASGAVELGDTVSLRATIQFESADRARQGATEFTAQSVQLASVASHFEVTATDTQVAVAASIAGDKIAALLADTQLGL